MANEPSPDPLFTLRGDMSAIHCLLFKSEGGSEFLYASTQTGTVHKWNLQSCREEYQQEVTSEACLAIRISQNSFISQSKGGYITVWEEAAGKWTPKVVVSSEYWGFCKFNVCCDKFLVCPGPESKIKIVSLEGKPVNTLSATISDKCGEIMVVKCFERSKTDYIFVLYESGVIALFKFSGESVNSLKVTTDCPMGLDFDGDSKGVIGSSGATIIGFNLTTDLKVVKWKETEITNAGVSSVAIRPDRRVFAAGCWDARIRLFSFKSFKLLAVLQGHKEAIQDLSFSPSRISAWNAESLLAVAGKDGRITLWNLY